MEIAVVGIIVLFVLFNQMSKTSEQQQKKQEKLEEDLFDLQCKKDDLEWKIMQDKHEDNLKKDPFYDCKSEIERDMRCVELAEKARPKTKTKKHKKKTNKRR